MDANDTLRVESEVPGIGPHSLTEVKSPFTSSTGLH